MLRLHEYPEAIDEILGRIEDAGGELTPEIEVDLHALFQGLDDKVRGIQRAIKSLQAMDTAAGAEAARLRAVQQRFSRRIDALKAYLLGVLRHEALDRYVTELGGISRCKNSQPKIRWTWSGDPPAEFVRRREVVEIDHEAVLEAHRHGLLPDGFEVEHGEHLRLQ